MASGTSPTSGPHPQVRHAAVPARRRERSRPPQPTTFLPPAEPCRLSCERLGHEIRGPPYLARYEKPRTQLPAPRNRAHTGPIRVPYNGHLARECEGFGHDRLELDSGNR